MSWREEEEYRRGLLRQPDASELAEALEARRRRGETFRPTSHEWVEVPNNPDAATALRPILAAGRLSRFRVLDVACPKNHRIAEVVRTGSGLVVTGKSPEKYVEIERVGGDDEGPDPDGVWRSISWEVDFQRTNLSSRAVQACLFLDSLLAEGRIGSVAMQCRCRTVYLDGAWLTEKIGAGRRRVVFD